MEVLVSDIRKDKDHVVKKTIDIDGFDEMIGGFEDHRASTPLEVDLTFSRLQGEDILARGTLRGSVAGPCRRCLEAVAYPVDVDVVVTFVPKGRVAQIDGDELELEPDDLDVLGYEEGAIQIGDLVRETVLLEITPYPPCNGQRDECDALEKQLNRLAKDGDDDAIDPRWAALMELKKNNDGESN